MPSKDRPSGGARETERKRRAQEAERGERYAELRLARIRRLRRKNAGAGAEKTLDRMLALLEDQAWEAATDPGMPPEYAREQSARIAAMVVRAAEPKKLIEELGADLREANAVIEQLRAPVDDDAPQEPAGDSSEPPPEDRH
jgi:hypothetical protein